MTNQTAIVSVEQLTNSSVLNLIERAEAFKQGATCELTRPVYAMNLFLKIALGPKRVLKWPNASSDYQ